MSFIGKAVKGIGSALFGSGSSGGAFRAPGYQQQGDLLNQLFTGNLVGANPGLQSSAQQMYPGMDFSGFQNQMQQLPELNFGQRSPYQFSQINFDPMTAVGDAFTPQANNLQNIFARRETDQLRAFDEDINRRGLFSSGAALQGTREIKRDNSDALSNALAALSGQQAQQQLGAHQFGANLNFQRDLNQAQEIFRQQGATDDQAMALANNALQRAQFQNAQQRQPIEDLLRLYSFSTGATPYQPAQPGLVQSIAPSAASAGLAALFACLPKGTEIEMEDGTKEFVEQIKVGDRVLGGNVIAVFSKKRSADHKFSLHKFKTGEVVMTQGHPFFDDLLEVSTVEHDSPNTYDILTDKGFYYVNGVKLGSTLEVLNG